MKVIAKPQKEKKILLTVAKSADKKMILKNTESKAECCVNHLCGCK